MASHLRLQTTARSRTKASVSCQLVYAMHASGLTPTSLRKTLDSADPILPIYFIYPSIEQE